MVKFKVDDSNYNKIYPIGSIYMSINETNPSELFGGEWEQIKDTFLLACGDNYNNGATGGSADAIIVAHSHSMENNEYNFVAKKRSDNASTKRVTVPTSGSNYAYVSSANSSFANYGLTNSKGESGTGKNMPPYLAVYVWVRTG